MAGIQQALLSQKLNSPLYLSPSHHIEQFRSLLVQSITQLAVVVNQRNSVIRRKNKVMWLKQRRRQIRLAWLCHRVQKRQTFLLLSEYHPPEISSGLNPSINWGFFKWWLDNVDPGHTWSGSHPHISHELSKHAKAPLLFLGSKKSISLQTARCFLWLAESACKPSPVNKAYGNTHRLQLCVIL